MIISSSNDANVFNSLSVADIVIERVDVVKLLMFTLIDPSSIGRSCQNHM